MQHDTKYREGKILFDRGLYGEAAAPLLAAAETGHADAQNEYGFLCKSGLGVSKDLEQAVHWYQKAAEQGHGDATHNLALLLVEMDGQAGIPAAVEWLKVNASRGHALSQVQLGHFFKNGIGVEASLSEALRLMRAAAAQGHSEAALQVGLADRYGATDHKGPFLSYSQCEERAKGGDAAAMRLLGAYCMLGYGCQPSRDAARAWIERAAQGGDVPALRALGVFRFDEEVDAAIDAQQAAMEEGDVDWLRDNWSLIEGRTTQAIECWVQAADAGDAYAMYLLGCSWLDGKAGSVDPARGMQLLEDSAAKGNTDACAVLGDQYRIGEVIEQDMDLAVHWYKQAAQAGHVESQHNLGVILAGGVGVTPDLSMGVHWLEKAASCGWADAQCNLGIRYLQGDGVDTDASIGTTWLRKAAEQGHAHAIYSLGVCYQRGEGVPADQRFGEHLWRKAAEMGDEGASAALQEVGTGQLEPLNPKVAEPARSHAEPAPSQVGAELAAAPAATMPVEPEEPTPAAFEQVAGTQPATPLESPSSEELSYASLVARMKWSLILAETALPLLGIWVATLFWEPISDLRGPAGWTGLALFVIGTIVRPSSEAMGEGEEAIESQAGENTMQIMGTAAGFLATWALFVYGADIYAWGKDRLQTETDSAATVQRDAEGEEGVTDDVGSTDAEELDSTGTESSEEQDDPYRIIVGPAGYREKFYVYLTRGQLIEQDIADEMSFGGYGGIETYEKYIARTKIIEVPYTVPLGNQGEYVGDSDDILRTGYELRKSIGIPNLQILNKWVKEVEDLPEGEIAKVRFFYTRSAAEAYRSRESLLKDIESPPPPSLY